MPNWVLKEDWIIYQDKNPITLTKGTFINPMEKSYAPKHTKDKYPGIDYNREVFCYTKYGIFPIPRDIIEEYEARFR